MEKTNAIVFSLQIDHRTKTHTKYEQERRTTKEAKREEGREGRKQKEKEEIVILITLTF